MKQLVVLALLALCGCDESHVLSSDGFKELGYCMGSNWIVCSNKLCPNGYDVVTVEPGCSGIGIIRCKP